MDGVQLPQGKAVQGGKGFNCLKPLQGGNLLFTTKFPEIPSTHNYIYLILINWRILQNLKNIPNNTLQVSPRANQFGNKKLRDDLSQRISRIIYTLRSEKYNSVTMFCILIVVMDLGTYF